MVYKVINIVRHNWHSGDIQVSSLFIHGHKKFVIFQRLFEKFQSGNLFLHRYNEMLQFS